MIAPCVNVLQHLSRMMHNILGSDQGTKHELLNLKDDIQDLMRGLSNHGVYTLNIGCTLNDDDLPVKDIITIVLQQLTDNSQNPLDKYNEAFKQLQAQRRLQAIISEGAPDPGEEPIESGFVCDTTATPFVQPPVQLPAPTLPSVLAPGEEGYESGEEQEEEDDVGEGEEGMDDTEKEEPTLHRETAMDVSLDMDADDYPEGVDDEGGDNSDEEEGDGFGLGEGIWHSDDKLDMNVAL